MVGVNELRRLNPVAWTGLLAREIIEESIVVAAVERETLDERLKLVRYVLSLDGYPEPVTFLGKVTNEQEAHFYQWLAPALPGVAPNCLLTHVEGEASWIVLYEPFDKIPAHLWTEEDFETIIAQMVEIHAAHWDLESRLERIGFRDLLGREMDTSNRSFFESQDRSGESYTMQPSGFLSRIENWQRGDQDFLSNHARKSAGNLLTELLGASEALAEIIRQGGWPGIFEARHWKVAAELLDDPIPMLHPLRQMPATLIQGEMSLESWHLDLLGNCFVIDWRKSKIGPAVYDLVSFIEQLQIWQEGTRINDKQPRAATEETLVDSYILAMGKALGRRFSPASTRQSIPAARCLCFLLNWLPKITEISQMNGLNQGSGIRNQLQEQGQKNDTRSGNYNHQDFYGNLCQRFLESYRLL